MKAIKFLSAGLLFSLIFSTAFGQTHANNKLAELKKLQTSVDDARAKVSACEQKMAKADSLVDVGTRMVAEAKMETKSIKEEQKRVDREYASEKKPFMKQSNSKEKEEAASAKAELKKLETKYKANSRDIQNRLRVTTKKQSTGSDDIERGKSSKKSAEDAYKRAKSDFDSANKKLEKAREEK